MHFAHLFVAEHYIIGISQYNRRLKLARKAAYGKKCILHKFVNQFLGIIIVIHDKVASKLYHTWLTEHSKHHYVTTLQDLHAVPFHIYENRRLWSIHQACIRTVVMNSEVYLKQDANSPKEFIQVAANFLSHSKRLSTMNSGTKLWRQVVKIWSASSTFACCRKWKERWYCFCEYDVALSSSLRKAIWFTCSPFSSQKWKAIKSWPLMTFYLPAKPMYCPMNNTR